jgi:outer membrane protein OmpA-like peptidoglycan-associated protein
VPIAISILVVNSPDSMAAGPGSIIQTAPLSNASPDPAGTSFSDQLVTTGGTGATTFTPPGTLPTGVSVSTAGVISSNGTTPVGTYGLSGGDTDTVVGDTGSWTYTLVVSAVPVTQTAPLSNASPDPAGTSFSDQLVTTGGTGATTFTPPGTLPTGVTVSTAGVISSNGTTPVGTYGLSGGDSDTLGDTGSWTYTLVVSAVPVTQTAPLSNASPDLAGTAFSDQLATTGGTGATTFTPPGTLPTGVTVSTAGVISSNGTTPVGTYGLSGGDSDTLGDTGSWTYTLVVTGVVIAQASPIAGTIEATISSVFHDQLAATGNTGSVTYLTTVPNAGLNVSSSGAVTTTGVLTAGPYTVSGTDSDSLNDSGTWTFSLLVTAAPGGGGGSSGGTLRQTSPTKGATTPSSSSSFVIGAVTVANASGTVTFITTTSSSGLNVTSDGAVTTTGTLLVGSYTVAGTVSDSSGNTGTWTYTLSVNNPSATVTFEANLGKGTMVPEVENTPTALTPNLYTRSGYRFDSWNTVADGSGSSYANGGTYPFTSSVTLYAQWTATKTVAVSHTVSYNANGGVGSMPSETKNVLAVLTLNRFIRTGYTFARWSTSADGSGSSYANGGAYPFDTSVTLFAQWTAAPTFTVTFSPNHGVGSMPPETKSAPAALRPNIFTWTEHDFVRWNTAADGSGSSYANGATYPFTASTVLYAQWKSVKVVVLPAVDAAVTLSPFAANSSLLSPALKSQIARLARDIKVNRDTKIALVGYSGKLAAGNTVNEAAWAANLKISGERAVQVEAYLRQQLAALGVRSYSITAVGTGHSDPPGSLATAVSQAKNRCVIATIT